MLYWFIIFEFKLWSGGHNIFSIPPKLAKNAVVVFQGLGLVTSKGDCVKFDRFTSSQCISYKISIHWSIILAVLFSGKSQDSDDELSSNTSSSCNVESLQLTVEWEGSFNSVIVQRASIWVVEEGDVTEEYEDDEDGILREIISFTRSFMINTRPLVRCFENSDRKRKQIPCLPRIASSRLVYCSSIKCSICECIWFCNVTLDLCRETVTQHTSRQPNGSVWMTFRFIVRRQPKHDSNAVYFFCDPTNVG